MQVSVLEASRLAYEFGIITLRQEMRHLDQEEEGLVFESIDVFASTCVNRPTPVYYYSLAFAFIFDSQEKKARKIVDPRDCPLPRLYFRGGCYGRDGTESTWLCTIMATPLSSYHYNNAGSLSITSHWCL
ncbi:hypothetical protein V8C40DRAFT_182439 [Trichoderma camerunense]